MYLNRRKSIEFVDEISYRNAPMILGRLELEEFMSFKSDGWISFENEFFDD